MPLLKCEHFSFSLPIAMNKETQNNQSSETPKKSPKFSKAKNLATAGLTAAMIAGISINADAQIQELGTIDDGARNSWLLKDMG